MTSAKIFDLLFNGGNITLPYLVAITCDGLDPIYLVNNNQDITYNGHIYKASTFDYTPPDNTGEGASLSMSTEETDIVNFIDSATDKAQLQVTGLIVANNDVQSIHAYKHYYGNVTIDEGGTITWSLGKDNRLEMVFNPYMYDTDLNRGNS